jgi:hypothetical protein
MDADGPADRDRLLAAWTGTEARAAIAVFLDALAARQR